MKNTKNKNFRDEKLNLRVTIDEKEKLKTEAKLAGISVSELVRRRYFGRPIIANVDLIMIKELRRIGGLLKYTLVESKGAYKEEVNDTIIILRKFIERLAVNI